MDPEEDVSTSQAMGGSVSASEDACRLDESASINSTPFPVVDCIAEKLPASANSNLKIV